MAYYSEDLIDEVLSSTDIVELIGEYVQLRRRGANYIGLCPFHKEKTPSFTVSAEKQIYKCFGCSEGGSAIQFVMKIENLDFREALEFLAERAGIDLSRFTVSSNLERDKQTKDIKERIFEINKIAAKYFYDALKENVEVDGSILREYLKKRQLDMQIVTRFGLGFGTKKDISLFKYLLKEGFTKEEMLKAGVVSLNVRGDVYESFSCRLIFPIFDTRDRVIGFGGRVLDNSLPKYVNSPENIVYHKGKNLYGMNIAKKGALDQILIVEGYMDAVALHKNGITNVVASLGTALTEGQAKLLKKYTSTVIIGYDQDNAGKAATMRAIDILYREGLKVKVLTLDHKDVKDPDEYINKYGKDRFLECTKNSLNYVDYKVKHLEETLNPTSGDINTKVDFLNGVANILAGIGNNIEREMYLNNISSVYNISKGAIVQEISKKTGVKKSLENQNVIVDIETMKNKRESSLGKKRRQEQYILALMLSKSRKIINKVKDMAHEKDFSTEELKVMYSNLKGLDKDGQLDKINVLAYFKKPEEVNLITEIMCLNINSLDKEKLILDIEREIKQDRYKVRMEEIFKRLSEKDVSQDEKEMLNVELAQIIIKKGNLK